MDSGVKVMVCKHCGRPKAGPGKCAGGAPCRALAGQQEMLRRGYDPAGALWQDVPEEYRVRATTRLVRGRFGYRVESAIWAPRDVMRAAETVYMAARYAPLPANNARETVRLWRAAGIDEALLDQVYQAFSVARRQGRNDMGPLASTLFRFVAGKASEEDLRTELALHALSATA